MSIYSLNNKSVFVKGDYKPAKLYKGNTKIAGWIPSGKTGTEAEWTDTYDDIIEGTVSGNTVQLADYVAKDGLSSQIQSVWGTNLITNGDFSNGLTDWVAGGVLPPTISTEQDKINGNSLKFDTVGASSIGRKELAITNGNILYVSAWCYFSSFTSGANVVNMADYNTYNNLTTINANTTLLNQWQRVSALRTIANDGVRFMLGSTSNATRTMYVDGVIAINLTATFGAGKEPTTAQVDVMLSQYPSSWFNGKGLLTTDTVTYTANSPSPEYPSEIYNTKNLFNGTCELGYWDVSTGEKKSHTTDVRCSDYIAVNSLNTYTLSGWSGGTSTWWVFYDNTKTRIGSTAGNTVTTIANTAFITFYRIGTNVLPTQLQLELGAAATTYEPYIGAGTYKITCTDGIYEFTLDDDMRGIETIVDKVVVDKLSHKGYLLKACNKQHVTTVDAVSVNRSRSTLLPIYGKPIVKCIFDKLVYKYNYAFVANTGFLGDKVHVYWSGASNALGKTVADGQAELDAMGGFDIVYQLDVPTKTPITFTKVASSTAPEFPATAIETTPSLDYPWGLYDAGNCIITSQGRNLFTMDNLLKHASGVEITSIGKNAFVAKSISIADWQRVWFQFKLKPNTPHKLSYILAKSVGTSNITGTGYIATDVNGSNILTSLPEASGAYSFTTTSAGDIFVVFYISAAVSELCEIELKNIQIEEGTITHTYIPYYSAPSIITLPVQLRKIGTVADTYNLGTGLYKKNIEVIESYNGETITTPYISTTGELSIGATVYYQLDTPETQLGLEPLKTFSHYTKLEQSGNNLLCNLQVTSKVVEL